MQINNKIINHFWSKVYKTKNCWQWIGALDKNGYGHFRVGTSVHLAHRVSWIIHNYIIDMKICVCHKCDNPSCVNPKHLFLGSHKDNAIDMIKKGRSCRGEQHRNTKLNQLQIRVIRKLYYMYQNEGFSLRIISKIFQISKSQVYKIVNKQSWSYL